MVLRRLCLSGTGEWRGKGIDVKPQSRLRYFGKMALWLAGATLLMAGACTTQNLDEDDDGGDSCGDGKVSGAEQCDGSNFADRTCVDEGWETGELACSSSCTIVADACTIIDDDLDGLSLAGETAAGTDPANPDSDGDGILDGAEVDNGANPLEIFSWPQGLGMWPNRLEASKEGLTGVQLGWGEGDVLFNQPWTDQFGQRVQLHQFYGYVVVLSVGAVWCPPCNQAAATSQDVFDAHRDQGVIFVEQLNDGNQQGVDATQQDVDGWVASYNMQFPVVWADYALFNAPSIPTFYILDRGLAVREVISGYPGDAALSAAINSVVAASQ